MSRVLTAIPKDNPKFQKNGVSGSRECHKNGVTEFRWCQKNGVTSAIRPLIIIELYPTLQRPLNGPVTTT